MASMESKVEKAVDFSKNLPWYIPDLEDVNPAFRELLEKYSGILPERVKDHVFDMVIGARQSCEVPS